jgi:hypothetical protein
MRDQHARNTTGYSYRGMLGNELPNHPAFPRTKRSSNQQLMSSFR